MFLLCPEAPGAPVSPRTKARTFAVATVLSKIWSCDLSTSFLATTPCSWFQPQWSLPPEHILIISSNSCRALFLTVKFLLKPHLIRVITFTPPQSSFSLCLLPPIVFITAHMSCFSLAPLHLLLKSLLSLLLYTHCLD